MQYMDFLAHVYTSYEERNALIDLTRGNEFYHDSPVKGYPKLPSSPLAVMPYYMRPNKELGELEYGLPGQWCSGDHTPGFSVIKRSIQSAGKVIPAAYDVTTTRSVPYRLHIAFHKENARVPANPYDAACEQMEWYNDKLGQLGYSQRVVNESEARVHAMNRDLGIYSLKDPESRIYTPKPWEDMRNFNASRGRQPSPLADLQHAVRSRS